MNVVSQLVVRFAVLAAGVMLAGAAVAQDFPSRPITVIVPFPPGGVTDPVARLVGQRISDSVGQPVVVDNRPGGAGVIGAMVVKQARPDGYTIFFGHFATHTVNPFLYSKLPYDAVKDFAPITPIVSSKHLLVVPAASPAKSVTELVALAKSKPEGLTFASQGIGAGGHLLGEMLKVKTGANLQHVAYKGSAPAIQDILAGRVDLFFDALITSGPHVREGRLRALAIASPVRAPLFPDVPTMAEAGFPGIEGDAWFGMFAPAGTPQPVVQKLHAEFLKAMSNPDVVKTLTSQGLDIFTLRTPDEFVQLIAADTAKYGKVVRDAGVKVD